MKFPRVGRPTDFARGFGLTTIPVDQDPATYLAKTQWTAASNFLLNFTLPKHVFPETAGQGLGVTPDGPLP